MWHDEFESQQDRKDSPPIALPSIERSVTLTLVRHGQSEWNAAGRIQGSSDDSKLTEKGRRQAAAAQQRLEGCEFGALFSSPLQRSAVTADIIWAGRTGSATYLPSLREIDLYSFQGLLKEDGKALHGEQYEAWKNSPADFEIDGHAPVRELWYRASLALNDILTTSSTTENTLVVAHNAVNQAVVGVSLGLPPTAFRRLVQSNAATTAVRYHPQQERTAATLQHLNEAPELLAGLAAKGVPAAAVRILSVACGSDADRAGDADVVNTTGEALSLFQVDMLICDDGISARAFQHALVSQRPADMPPLAPHVWHPLRSQSAGAAARLPASEDVGEAFRLLCSQLWRSKPDSRLAGGLTVLVITSNDRAAALAHCLLGIGAEECTSPSKGNSSSGREVAVECQTGGISCIDLVPDDDPTMSRGTVHCVNNRAHLFAGKEAAPAAEAEGNASDM